MNRKWTKNDTTMAVHSGFFSDIYWSEKSCWLTEAQANSSTAKSQTWPFNSSWSMWCCRTVLYFFFFKEEHQAFILRISKPHFSKVNSNEGTRQIANKSHLFTPTQISVSVKKQKEINSWLSIAPVHYRTHFTPTGVTGVCWCLSLPHKETNKTFTGC